MVASSPPKKEIKISSEAFDEMTGALNDAGIKLDIGDSFVVSKDIAIKGPINYRQVNLRHQIMMEAVKVYRSPLKGDFEVSDSQHFINYLDDIYQYILKGERKQNTPTAKPKPATTSVKPANKW